ncbi:MAG: radical SAM protein [Acidobacteriota bacterium]
MKRLRRWLRALLKPRTDEREALNREQWERLPERLRTPQQASGRAYVGCGATHGVMERCNFSCTSCYLSDVANTLPPLPFDEVREQLETLRRHLGPAGKAQVTAGEVTLLPLDELGRIVSHARDIGLDPMVMSHGARFEDEPEYLESLVRDHGLEKVSIHVDSTQRGRRGHSPGATEKELNAVRDRMAALIRRVRRTTGRRLHAAQTVTVVPENVVEVPDIMRWCVANADAFRMISFQPVAEVGRTRDRRSGTTLDDVWERICDGLGRRVHRSPLLFGHPDCNVVCPVIVVDLGDRREIVESVREGDAWDLAVVRRLLEHGGGIRQVGATWTERVLRRVGVVLRNPGVLAWGLPYALYRLWGERRWLPAALGRLLTLRPVRVRPLAIIVHAFMDAEELATSLGQERLAACTFKVAVDGEMVSMCEVNASGLRRELNLAQRERLVPERAAEAGASR